MVLLWRICDEFLNKFKENQSKILRTLCWKNIPQVYLLNSCGFAVYSFCFKHLKIICNLGDKKYLHFLTEGLESLNLLYHTYNQNEIEISIYLKAILMRLMEMTHLLYLMQQFVEKVSKFIAVCTCWIFWFVIVQHVIASHFTCFPFLSDP